MRSRVVLKIVALLAIVALSLIFPATDPTYLPMSEAGDHKPPSARYLPPKGYVCYRAQAPIQIDGKLVKAVWRDIPWTDPFVDIEGDREASKEVVELGSSVAVEGK